jgi:RNA polymerase sigma factor (sigma-70 family)
MTKIKTLRFTPRVEEEELLAGLQSEGAARARAEQALFNTYAHYTRKAQSKYELSEDDALSAYADAVLALISHVHQGNFRGESKLSTYLFQIFQHKCVDLLRRNTSQKRKADWVDELPHLGDAMKDALGKLIDQEQVERLKALLQKLGESCERLLLYWGEGYSMEEIASLLQFRDAASVKSRKYTCLQKLKTLFQPSSD